MKSQRSAARVANGPLPPKRDTKPPIAIEWRATERLIPYARNARQHSEAQIDQIAASIREFGWTNPVLVDGENGIIAGHARVLAARKLALARVPCIELAHLSEAQRRAYILADNKLALNASWDEELLGFELADLRAIGFDLGLTGFDAAAIEKLIAGLQPPGDFAAYDESIPTEHTCPKCGFRWSGQATANPADE